MDAAMRKHSLFGREVTSRHPKGYQRSTLTFSMIREYLSGRDWTPLSQIVVAVTRDIPPEAALRAFKSARKERGECCQITPEVVAKGKRLLVMRKLWQLCWTGLGHPIIERREGSSGPEYRLLPPAV